MINAWGTGGNGANVVGVNNAIGNVNNQPASSNTSLTTRLPTIPPRDDNTPNMHHHFRSKPVCTLDCARCETKVCLRGMKAMLLADTRIELFSTDVPPLSVRLVDEIYMTQNCHCKIRDVACQICNNTLGYHILQPCQQCMEACNNGHFWMFHTEAVTSAERMDADGRRPLLWAQLPRAEPDFEGADIVDDEYDEVCCR